MFCSYTNGKMPGTSGFSFNNGLLNIICKNSENHACCYRVACISSDRYINDLTVTKQDAGSEKEIYFWHRQTN
jgi:hypothetical protein